jgi:rubrerythrin
VKGEKTMNFEESVTKTNLARSFAGECQAGARYQFMSKIALEEQLQFISNTLKTLAKNEMAHAKAFYDFILSNSSGNVRNIPIEAGYPFEMSDLKSSLLEESKNEKSEAENIYPSFARIAKDEGFDEIAKTFEMIAKVEATHNQILRCLGDLYKSNKLYKRDKATKWKCSNCGHTETAKEGFKTCPVCKLPQGYIIIDLEKELS